MLLNGAPACNYIMQEQVNTNLCVGAVMCTP